MNHNRFSMNLFAALLIAVLALSACTIDQPEIVVDPETVDNAATDTSVSDTMTDTTGTDTTGTDTTTGTMDMTTATTGVGDASNVLVVASSLLDYSFENIDGEVSGEIEDLILDISTGNVLYATLEYGGFLDIGDTELPVPMNAFVWGQDGQLILNIDEAQLNEFPDLGTEWPDLTTATWDDDIVNFWSGAGITPANDFSEASDSIVRASDAIGYGVADVGVGAGTVSDMLIDLGNSQIAYALLGYDPTVYGNELVAVPFDALNISTVGNELVFNEGIDASVLENAPRVTTDNLAAGTPGVYNDANTYWGGYGYGYDPLMSDQTIEETQDDGAMTTDDAVDESTMADTTVNTGDTIGIAGSEDYLIRASNMINYDVYNLNGDFIGSINDMLINVQNGNVLFATLEYGGFLDIGDREIPMPLGAFNWTNDNELVLNADEQALEAMPEVNNDWPIVTDPTWNDEIVSFWNDLGIDAGYGADDAQTVMYVSNLVGFDLTDVGFGEQGSLNDILVDPSQSSAPYVIVDYGGLFNEDLVAVPFGAFDVTQEGTNFTFTPNIDLETMQNAPAIARNEFEQSGLYNRDFAQDWNNYWSNLGYELGITDTP